MNNQQFPRLITALQHQQVIAYPTEAVFGLGCDPDSELAVKRLLALKQRAMEKGLILIAASYQQLQSYIDERLVPAARHKAALACWPGPVTLVFPAHPDTPRWLTGRFNSLAVRVSAHPPVIALCQAYGKPLVSTSANLSGHAPCRTPQQVVQQFGTELPLLSAATGGRENPSEIRDALTGQLWRPG